MTLKKTSIPTTEAQTKTRTLLALWDLGGTEVEVKKSELTRRIQRSNEKSRDYQGVFEKLEKEGAIAIATKSRIVNVSLTEQGFQMLSEELKNPKFEYEVGVGAKTVNTLLKWIRQMNSAVSNLPAPAKAVTPAIVSYEKFEYVALQVYDHLNRGYNLEDLVPIYKIRREIGDRVSRTQFNEWLLEMQAKDILQLQGGSLPDNDSTKIEDSITTEVSGLRCYAKRLSS